MRRAAIAASVIALAVFVVGVSAQGKPNFSGTWTQFDPDPAAAATGGGGRGAGRGGMMGGGWGTTAKLTQDATTLKVERTQGQATVTETYTLEGSGKNTLPAFREGGAPTDVTYTSKWDGAKLVITTKQELNMQGNAMAIETKRELSLDAGNLVIVTTRSGMPMGGGGQAPAPVTVKYKKG